MECSFTSFLRRVLRVSGVFVLEGERLLRHLLEGGFGGDVTRGLPRHGVLVVGDGICRQVGEA